MIYRLFKAMMDEHVLKERCRQLENVRCKKKVTRCNLWHRRMMDVTKAMQVVDELVALFPRWNMLQKGCASDVVE